MSDVLNTTPVTIETLLQQISALKFAEEKESDLLTFFVLSVRAILIGEDINPLDTIDSRYVSGAVVGITNLIKKMALRDSDDILEAKASSFVQSILEIRCEISPVITDHQISLSNIFTPDGEIHPHLISNLKAIRFYEKK